MARKRRRSYDRPIDPGVAAIAAAAVAGIATVSVALIDRGGSDDNGTVSSASIAATDATDAPTTPATTSAATATASAPTSAPAPTTTATSSPSTIVTTPASVEPTVQFVAGMGEVEREIIGPVAEQLSEAAARLPLVVQDRFVDNRYFWPTGERVFDGGSTCTWRLDQGSYTIMVETADGAAYCRGGLDKRLQSFSTSIELEFDRAAPATASVWYRVSEDKESYYSVTVEPLTRRLSMDVVVGGTSTTLLQPAYVDDLVADGTNRVDIVALGTSHLVYVNSQLAVLVSDEGRIDTAGTIEIVARLDEPDASLALAVTRFDVHGTSAS